jgi:HKD family nuclease
MKPLLVLSLVSLACAPRVARNPLPETRHAPALLLVESSPVETTLGHPDLPSAKEEWPKLIGEASRSLDFEEFYATNGPGSALENVIQAMEAAARRGVHIRFLADQKMSKSEPQTLERLAAIPNIEVRRIDFGKLAGGVQHSKFFLVDRSTVYIGSQNFDWRSLEHIQELGVEVRVPRVVASVQEVFDRDWSAAGGQSEVEHLPSAVDSSPVRISQDGEALELSTVFSPKGWIPVEAQWELPKLVEMIDHAKTSVRVQLLTYDSTSKEGQFTELEDALVRASRRGVHVQLLLSEWTKRERELADARHLAGAAKVEIKLMVIPEASQGPIPYARLIHAKYMTVDGERAWVGTSNWGRSYFLKTRGVGLIVRGRRFSERLARFFDDDWNSPYAQALPL